MQEHVPALAPIACIAILASCNAVFAEGVIAPAGPRAVPELTAAEEIAGEEWIPSDAPDDVEAVERIVPSGYDADKTMALEPDACLALLDDWHVPYEAAEGAPGSILTPIRLAGPVVGVTFRIPWRARESHDVLDCRLAVALAQWAVMLRERGIVEVHLFSFYRQGNRRGTSDSAGRGLSQHHFGLAVDAGWFVLEGDEILSVKDDFAVSGSGEACEREPDGDRAAILVGAFCDAQNARLFHVQLSPLHNADHHNHYHLDVGGGGGGWYVE